MTIMLQSTCDYHLDTKLITAKRLVNLLFFERDDCDD